MAFFDDMSDLSIPADGQIPSVSNRRTFHCKVFGCTKSYAHSSSLYRHVGTAHPMRGSFRNESTLPSYQFDFAINRGGGDGVGALKVNRSVVEIWSLLTGQQYYVLSQNIEMLSFMSKYIN